MEYSIDVFCLINCDLVKVCENHGVQKNKSDYGKLSIHCLSNTFLLAFLDYAHHALYIFFPCML